MLGRCKFSHVRYVLAYRQIRPFVVERNICHFCGMVGLRAKVLGRLGRKPSPHPRASALSCPSLDIYRPELPDGAPAFMMLPLLAASWEDGGIRRGPSLCPAPIPQGVSYVHHGHKSAKIVHKKLDARRRGRPSSGAPGPIGVARCGLSRRRELRLSRVLRTSHVRSSRKFGSLPGVPLGSVRCS